MLLRLLVAFIVVPLVELYLLLRLAEWTSVMTTVGIVIGTGVLGSVLARREGLRTWFRFRRSLAANRVPSREIQDGLMIVFAAALLLTPGLLTDVLGFALLLPAGRAVIRRWMLRGWAGRTRVTLVSYQENGLGREPGGVDFGNRDPARPTATIDAESYRRKA